MRRTVFEIDEIPKDLRQYFEMIEVKCGAPWRRVVEKTGKLIQHHWAPGTQEKIQIAQGKHGLTSTLETGFSQEKTTTGWRPTCKCPHTEADLIPCTVLDPFSGAGTTALVAAKLGRDSIGVELNEDYVEMSRKRIVKDLGMLVTVEVVK